MVLPKRLENVYLEAFHVHYFSYIAKLPILVLETLLFPSILQ